jgi:hypothetical protein
MSGTGTHNFLVVQFLIWILTNIFSIRQLDFIHFKSKFEYPKWLR